MGTIPTFLKQKEESLYFNGPGEFVFFIPEVYFERKVAIIDGEYIDVIGILNYTILKSDKDSLTKNLKTFKYPSTMTTKPGKLEKIKNFKITDNSDPTDYRILRYTDNGSDQIVVSVKTPQDIANVERFFSLFVNTGNIPANISYDDLHNYFLESMEINGANYKISAHLFGLIVSELCRDPQDMNKPFRNSKIINTDMKSYRPVSIKTIPKLISPYSAITSENWDESVIGAIMNPNTNKHSPLEKVLTK